MGLLVEACPSFAASRYGGSEADLYEELGAFAHHLVDLAERRDADEFPAVFEVVDAVLAQGDDAAVAAVRTSLIEDLQNITSHRDVAVDPDAFIGVLGPLAAEVWEQLDEAWAAAALDSADRPGRIPAEDYLFLGDADRRRVQSMTRELPDGTLARPSDVLRYEAQQYDEAVTNFRRFIRGSIVWFVAFAAIAVALIWLFT